MAKNSSFDIVSQIDMQELDNALNQTRKEIEQRYDFRGSNATIELADGDLKNWLPKTNTNWVPSWTSCGSGWPNGACPSVPWIRARWNRPPKAPYARP